MALRGVTAGAALAVALAGGVVPVPATADSSGDSCDTAPVIAGAIAGYVGFGDDEDWWRQPAVPGYYVVTLTSGAAEADLSVGGGSCGTLCVSGTPIAPDTCFVHTSDGGITVGVRSSAPTPVAYVATIALLVPSTTACHDRIDNDGDGVTDWPADAGCADAADTTEDMSPCFRAVAVAPETCVEVVTGGQRERYTATKPANGQVEVAAYVDRYKFGSLGGVVVACVVLYSDPPDASVNPCRAAGGKHAGRIATLFRVPRNDVPDPGRRDELAVRVCDAVLNVSVDGKRLPPVDVLAVC